MACRYETIGKYVSKNASDDNSFTEGKIVVSVLNYAVPVICIVGTITNVIALIVLFRKKPRSLQNSPFLLTLGFVDILVLYSGLAPDWIYATFNLEHVHLGIEKYFASVCVHCASWLAVLLTIERVVAVFYPFKVRSLCTRRKSLLAIIVCFALLSLLSCHWLIGYRADGSITDSYSIFHCLWSWVDAAVCFLIPFLIIAVGNFAIVLKLKYFTGTQQQSRSSHRGGQMTRILIAVSLALFITACPMHIAVIYTHYYGEGSDHDSETQILVIKGLTLLMHTNSCINIFLYCITSSLFRQEIRVVFKCHKQSS